MGVSLWLPLLIDAKLVFTRLWLSMETRHPQAAYENVGWH